MDLDHCYRIWIFRSSNLIFPTTVKNIPGKTGPSFLDTRILGGKFKNACPKSLYYLVDVGGGEELGSVGFVVDEHAALQQALLLGSHHEVVSLVLGNKVKCGHIWSHLATFCQHIFATSVKHICSRHHWSLPWLVTYGHNWQRIVNIWSSFSVNVQHMVANYGCSDMVSIGKI